MTEVRLLPRVTLQQLEEVRFTRLNQRFHSAFNLARLFLESLAPQLLVEREEAFAFMFDMNVLFERFVASFLKRHYASIFQFPFENIRIITQASGRTRYLAEQVPDAISVFPLKPDILLIAPDGSVAGIVDTKYKRLSSSFTQQRVSSSDFYQLLAYSVGLSCPRAMLLYPTVAVGEIVQSVYQVKEQATTICVGTVELHRPLDQPTILIENLRQSMGVLLGER